ncbi:MAG: DUF3185 family protein [Planctomycetota bacterium]|nr:DUF3185 family protein [Planctomycetota bacterium]
MRTRQIVAIILLVAGVALIARGIKTSQSFGSRVSEFFTGSPTDLSVWQALVGTALLIGGISLMLTPGKALRD